MIKEKENIIQRNRFVLLSFTLTLVSMLMIYICNQLVPIGDNTVLRMDLYHQYGPLFSELYDRLIGGDSLIYSWNSGLGSCFLGNYFNYLSSPIGAIVVFFGHKNTTEAIAVMVLIKAALSSAAFTYFLKKSKTIANQSFVSAAFGVMYAICAYMIAYYWNIMWLDAMVLLPIVLLGIERIIDYGKPSFYITGLALSMFSNYYMSFMLCLFSVIYFFYYYATHYSTDSKLVKKDVNGLVKKFLNNRFLHSCMMFGFASLAAAGLMAIVLIPVYNILQSCSATSDAFPTEFKTYFTFYDFFSNHFAGLIPTVRSSGDTVLPNVYCGVLTIVLAPLFFFTKTISKKEKLTTLLLLSIFYVSFNVNIFNFIWHGMHFPNDLPYRFSFIYSFILLVVAYKTFIRLNEFNSKQVAAVGVGILAFVVLVEKLTAKNVNALSVVLTMAFVVIYVLILAMFHDKRYATVSIAMLLSLFVCSEAVIGATPAMSISVTKSSYVDDYDSFQRIKKQLDVLENNEFYRMELAYLRTRMDPSWYNYNGVSVFSSMAYEKLANLQNNLGMMSNVINSYTYNPQTPIYNMMFSLKYIVNNETANIFSDSYYRHISTYDKYDSYANKYYLPIAYQVDEQIEDWQCDFSNNHDLNPFFVQADYFKKATGSIEEPFKQLHFTNVGYSNVNPFTESLDSNTKFYYSKSNNDLDGSATFYLTPEESGNIYIYYNVDGASEKLLTVTAGENVISKNAREKRVMDLGYFQEGETITINVPFEANTGYISMYAYTMNHDVFESGYNKLKEGEMNVEVFEDTYIKGSLDVQNDGILYTSIPYDTGWKVTIDGVELDESDIVAIGNSLLGVRIQTGDKQIEFKYEVNGMKTGLIISGSTLLLLLLYIMTKLLKKKFAKKSKLPVYPIDYNEYTTDVILPHVDVKKNISNIVYHIQSAKHTNTLPVKEIYKIVGTEAEQTQNVQDDELLDDENVLIPKYDIMDMDLDTDYKLDVNVQTDLDYNGQFKKEKIETLDDFDFDFDE